jgi:hypothetical protein
MGADDRECFTWSDITHPEFQWHWVASVRENNWIRLYVDGNPAGARALIAPVFESGEKIFIGRMYSTHSRGDYGYAEAG